MSVGMEHFTIATVAEKSPDFRRVLWTGEHTQLVIMTIVSGVGEARVGGNTRKVAAGDLVVVPAGTKHNFVNTGPNPLVLYTVYGPPEHADKAVHRTREEADAAEEAGEDQPPTS